MCVLIQIGTLKKLLSPHGHMTTLMFILFSLLHEINTIPFKSWSPASFFLFPLFLAISGKSGMYRLKGIHTEHTRWAESSQHSNPCLWHTCLSTAGFMLSLLGIWCWMPHWEQLQFWYAAGVIQACKLSWWYFSLIKQILLLSFMVLHPAILVPCAAPGMNCFAETLSSCPIFW